MIKVIEIEDLNSIYIADISYFFKKNKFDKNIIFIAPVWIRRMQIYFYMKFKYTLFYSDGDLIAVHLIFRSFRGYVAISRYNFFIRLLLQCILSVTHKIQWWKVPVLIKESVSEDKKKQIETKMCKLISGRFKTIQSPVTNKHLWERFLLKKWGTLLFDFHEKSYDDIYSKFHRSLKRCLKKYELNSDIYCNRLNFNDMDMLEKLVEFVLKEQINTNKNYPISRDSLLRERSLFEHEGNIFEIFVLYCKKNIIGSIRIYGSNNYISESQAITSISASKNKINAQYLLKNSVIKYCIKENIRYYDLSGVNPSTARSSKEEGIYNFKNRFGAKLISYDTVSLL